LNQLFSLSTAVSRFLPLIIVLAVSSPAQGKISFQACWDWIAGPPMTSQEGVQKSWVEEARERDNQPTLISDPHPKLPYPARINEKTVNRVLKDCLPADRKPLKFLLDVIRASHVGFSEFREALNYSASQFVAKNFDIVLSRKFVAFSMYDGRWGDGKSNLWTLDLLMEKAADLKFPPELLLFHSSSSLSGHMQSEKIKDVLLVDDAAYSGRQIGVALTEIARQSPRNIKVHIVLPFLTDAALREIDSHRGSLNIEVYSYRRFPSFGTHIAEAVSVGALSASAAQRLHELFYIGEDKPILFFDHKLPDFLSTIADSVGRTILTKLTIPTGRGQKTFRIVEANPPPYDEDQ
jgi:hypothetical protein